MRKYSKAKKGEQTQACVIARLGPLPLGVTKLRREPYLTAQTTNTKLKRIFKKIILNSKILTLIQ